MEKKENLRKLFQKFLENTKDDWNYITPSDFYHKYYLSKKQNYFLLDVRNKDEFQKYHIHGAKNIFWLDLLKKENIALLPKNKVIFVICYVGHTSSQILVLLKLLGFNVVSIKFGYGISPTFGVPVAGWTNFRFPTTMNVKKNTLKTKKNV